MRLLEPTAASSGSQLSDPIYLTPNTCWPAATLVDRLIAAASLRKSFPDLQFSTTEYLLAAANFLFDCFIAAAISGIQLWTPTFTEITSSELGSPSPLTGQQNTGDCTCKRCTSVDTQRLKVTTSVWTADAKSHMSSYEPSPDAVVRRKMKWIRCETGQAEHGYDCFGYAKSPLSSTQRQTTPQSTYRYMGP
jgi:hypothetical protein